MEPKYLKLSKGEKDIYFRINNIKKYYKYSSHGIELYDYDVIINDIYVYDNKSIKEGEGLFLSIDEKKKYKNIW